MDASRNSSQCQRLAPCSGFTLIELMVTIAVLAIIVSIAAPNIGTQLANQRVKSTTATLTNALREAKVESVIRRQNMTVSFDGATSPKTITLRDINNNVISHFNIDSQSAVSRDITPSSVTSVIFQPNKLIKDSAEVVYTICDSNSAASPRQIVVSAVAIITSQLGGSCP